MSSHYQFPFKTHLSFEEIIKCWKLEGNVSQYLKDYTSRVYEDAIKIPELNSIIKDKKILIKHKDLIEALLSSMFAYISSSQEISMAVVPFSLDFVHVSDGFKKNFFK